MEQVILTLNGYVLTKTTPCKLVQVTTTSWHFQEAITFGKTVKSVQ